MALARGRFRGLRVAGSAVLAVLGAAWQVGSGTHGPWPVFGDFWSLWSLTGAELCPATLEDAGPRGATRILPVGRFARLFEAKVLPVQRV